MIYTEVHFIEIEDLILKVSSFEELGKLRDLKNGGQNLSWNLFQIKDIYTLNNVKYEILNIVYEWYLDTSTTYNRAAVKIEVRKALD